jgi:hypothetical protein
MTTYPSMSRFQPGTPWKTGQQVFWLEKDEAVETAEFVYRYGTATMPHGHDLPEMKRYSDETGAVKPIGMAPHARTVLYEDGDALYQIGATYDHNRAMAPVMEANAYMCNTGTANIKYGDRIAACYTGFQKARSGAYQVGMALDDVDVKKWGFIHVDVEQYITGA